MVDRWWAAGHWRLADGQTNTQADVDGALDVVRIRTHSDCVCGIREVNGMSWMVACMLLASLR